MEKGSHAGHRIPVQACREFFLANPEEQSRDVMWWASALKVVIPCLQEKPLNVEASVTVPQTDSGGQGENPKVIE